MIDLLVVVGAAGGVRATSTAGVLSSQSACSDGRPVRGRPSHQISLPRAHSRPRRTELHLGNIGDGTIAWINARR